MKRLLLLFGLLLTYLGFSQTPELDWVSNVHSSGSIDIYGIKTTKEGYVYCLVSYEVGLSLPNYSYFNSSGDKDIAVVKLNRYGNFMWGKKIGGTETETAVRMHLLSNDNVLIVGGFQDTVDFDPSISSEEIRISHGEDDCFALILDKHGDYVNCLTFGGPNMDMLLGVDEDSHQNIWFSGRFEDSIELAPQGSNISFSAPNGSGSFIVKVDEQLNVLESISIHAKDDAVIYDIDVSRKGDVHFTAFFDDTLTINYADTTYELYSNGSIDCLYSIIDDGGNFIDHTQIGGSYFDFPIGLTESKDGTYVLQVMYEDSLPLMINNSSQFISGNTFTTTGNDFARNTAIVKFRDTEVLWCKTINCIYPGFVLPAMEPAIDGENNIYIAAGYRSRCTVNQSGFNDIGLQDTKGGLIAKLNSLGEFIGIYTVNGGGDMRPHCIHVDQLDLIIAGTDWGSNDYDLTENSYYPAYGGGVVAKYNLQDPFLFTEELSELETLLYPNPTSQTLNLRVPKASNLLIQDFSGREIKPKYHFDGETYQINTSQLANGVYTLSFEKGETRFTERFVVQH